MLVEPGVQAVARPHDEPAHEAVRRSRAAQRVWAARPFPDRAAALRRAARRMLEGAREALDAIAADTGKGEVEAVLSEVAGPLDQTRQWERIVRRALRRRRVRLPVLSFPGKRAFVDRVPRGVIAAITPWNYPLGTFFRPVLPALLTGNGVVVKPSEHAPRTAAWFVACLRAELPPGLVGLLPGGPEAGRALVEAGVDAVSFTGSHAAGREVGRRAAERGIPASLELGGKNPALVLADADPVRTVAGITHWTLHNAGQNCGAVGRLYVEAGGADAFVARLADAFGRLRVGPGPAEAVDVSPLAHEAQRAVVERHVADAVARGARVLVGGARAGSGLGYAPTLLDGCTDDMAVVREETFGPVLPVLRVADAEEAVRRANASDYGLVGSVWTRDRRRGEALATRLACGVVLVNDHAVSGAVVALPWTGWKGSGPGVANSEHALDLYLRPRTLLVDRSGGPDPWWMPHDGTLREFGTRLLEAQAGRPLRALGIPRLLRRRRRALRAFYEAAGEAASVRSPATAASEAASSGESTRGTLF